MTQSIDQLHLLVLNVGLAIHNADWNWQNIWKKRPLGKPKTVDCHKVLHCRDFSDYQSAKRYFDQCGSKTMDGNHDGIPCNKLYREAVR